MKFNLRVSICNLSSDIECKSSKLLILLLLMPHHIILTQFRKMYRIVFSVRSEKNKLPDEEVLKLCISQLWKNSLKEGIPALENIRKSIKPMGQLNSGLFLNLDNKVLNCDADWLELFKVEEDICTAKNFEVVKIAENYIKIKFLTQG